MRMNKPIAGYHILMILSAVDHSFSATEDMVIQKWLIEQFPISINLDKEMDVLSALPESEYMSHFHRCMQDFYDDSTESERNELMQFALQLAKADSVLSREENRYIDELFNQWAEDTI